MDESEARALEARVAGYATEQMPALARERVVLAASGGADSTAMVALLCEAGAIEPERTVVAHFDHALRDEGAARSDLAAVQELCSRFGLPLKTGVWAEPARGEAAARAARYGFLRAVASDIGARCVVTGHTSDDQVETVLMHAVRGAGLHGLAGMAPIAPLPVGAGSLTGTEVWRPLLGVSREETRAYCAARGLIYEDDATNDDRGFMRNRVRLELLPLMEAVAHDARAVLLALSAAARSSAGALDAIASTAIMSDNEACGAGEVALSRDALRALPADVVPHAYRLALTRLLGGARDFGRVHYGLLADAASANTGSTLELPRGVIATVDADAIVLSIGAPGPAPIASDFAAPIPYSGLAGAWEVEIHPASYDQRNDAMPISTVLTMRLPDGAVVRGRRPGDRVALLRGGHKKLQDLYVDAKVPRREREAAPVIAWGGDVLWTPLAGGRIAPASAGSNHRVSARRA